MDYHQMKTTAIVLHNRPIAKDIRSMLLTAPGIASSAVPGQFVMVSVSDDGGLFLRRPLSFAGIDAQAGTVELIYRTVGQGTSRMEGWKSGRPVDLLGPLGNGFCPDEAPTQVILAGGGLGIAPLLPLARELRSRDIGVTVFAGAASMDLMFGLSTFTDCGCALQLATDDGTGGFTGPVTLPLGDYLRQHFPQPGTQSDIPPGTQRGMLYACGPQPFLKAVAALCRDHRLAARLSLEERMGCGFGACMGCSVQLTSADGTPVRKRVCADGPVFRSEEVFPDG